MKKFHIDFITRKEDGEIINLNQIESDNLMELVQQFNLSLARLYHSELDELLREINNKDYLLKHYGYNPKPDDDIPF